MILRLIKVGEDPFIEDKFREILQERVKYVVCDYDGLELIPDPHFFKDSTFGICYEDGTKSQWEDVKYLAVWLNSREENRIISLDCFFEYFENEI